MNKLIVPKIVAELTVNHIGSKHIVTAMMLSAKENGADYIKLKLKNVKSYYSSSSTSGTKKWRNFEFQTYRSSLELTFEDLHYINSFAISNDIKWFSTIHDIDSLNLIRKFKVPFYKIASMDISNKELFDEVLNACKEDSKIFIFSIGGISLEETRNIVKKINHKNVKAILLHTVSIYPTPIGKSNINYLDLLMQEFKNDNISVGFSDHEEGISASVLASLKGIVMIERHFSLSKELKIHHIKTALLPNEFMLMVNTIKDIKEELEFEINEYQEEENEFLKARIYK
jgi:sialic acid synthase SpsE